MLKGILHKTQADEYQLFLSDNKENNFRFALTSTYKSNRIQPKPKWHEELKEYLISVWGARFSYGMEADDALGIAQDKDFDCWETASSVICSIDKDLKQVPGLHYNFVKDEWDRVTHERGTRYFYEQILVGDTSDNIQGCKGIGPVRAAKILGTASCTEIELLRRVQSTYRRQHPDWGSEQVDSHILLAGQLLKIRQSEEEEIWRFPQEPQTMEAPQSSSTLVTEPENGQYTVQCGPATDGAGSLLNGQA